VYADLSRPGKTVRIFQECCNVGSTKWLVKEMWNRTRHDNDDDNDKDELPGIVSLLVDPKCSFFGILYITHS
jgi:hypothetical protein